MQGCQVVGQGKLQRCSLASVNSCVTMRSVAVYNAGSRLPLQNRMIFDKQRSES
jgi:hypothetical protein